jgi:hypothetical protein
MNKEPNDFKAVQLWQLIAPLTLRTNDLESRQRALRIGDSLPTWELSVLDDRMIGSLDDLREEQ